MSSCCRLEYLRNYLYNREFRKKGFWWDTACYLRILRFTMQITAVGPQQVTGDSACTVGIPAIDCALVCSLLSSRSSVAFRVLRNSNQITDRRGHKMNIYLSTERIRYQPYGNYYRNMLLLSSNINQ